MSSPQQQHPNTAVACNNIIHTVNSNKGDPVAATNEWSQHRLIIDQFVDKMSPILFSVFPNCTELHFLSSLSFLLFYLIAFGRALKFGSGGLILLVLSPLPLHQWDITKLKLFYYALLIQPHLLLDTFLYVIFSPRYHKSTLLQLRVNLVISPPLPLLPPYLHCRCCDNLIAKSVMPNRPTFRKEPLGGQAPC